MKKIKTQLDSIAKNLSNLAKKIKKVSGEVRPGTKPAKKAVAKKTVAKKKPVARKTTKAKPKAKAKAKAKTTAAAAARKGTVLDKVYDVISKSRSGANIATLKGKTKLEARQLSNALYKLSKQGKIKSKSRGIYVKS
ncbi:MAG: hypothetical protein GY874_09610 [Desulfobacteraceae bacterium]|nr:hypothetical protein [Desulfobacteraceae bacterium]